MNLYFTFDPWILFDTLSNALIMKLWKPWLTLNIFSIKTNSFRFNLRWKAFNAFRFFSIYSWVSVERSTLGRHTNNHKASVINNSIVVQLFLFGCMTKLYMNENFVIYSRFFPDFSLYFHLHKVHTVSLSMQKASPTFHHPSSIILWVIVTDKQMDRKTLKWTYKYYWMELYSFLTKWCFSFYGFSCGYNKLYFPQTNYPLLSKLTFTKNSHPISSRKFG